jgi:hypothetical protein
MHSADMRERFFHSRGGPPHVVQIIERGLRRFGADPHAQGRRTVTNLTTYLGLDVHKETIAVAIADGRSSDVRFYGGNPEAIPTTNAVNAVIPHVRAQGRRSSVALDLLGLSITVPTTSITMPNSNSRWFPSTSLPAVEPESAPTAPVIAKMIA